MDGGRKQRRECTGQEHGAPQMHGGFGLHEGSPPLKNGVSNWPGNSCSRDTHLYADRTKSEELFSFGERRPSGGSRPKDQGCGLRRNSLEFNAKCHPPPESCEPFFE